MVLVNSRHLRVNAIGLGNGLDREVKEREMMRTTLVSNLHSWENGDICHFLIKKNMKRFRCGVDEGIGQGGKS